MSIGPWLKSPLLLGTVLGWSLLVIAGLLYWPGLDGPFLLDDAGSIGTLKATSFSLEELVYDITHNTSGLLGRPVSVLSLLFTKLLHGPGTWGFKYHNLLLHLLNTILLFWLLTRLLSRMPDGVRGGRVYLIAGTVCCLWLLHPLMVSTVLYAVQRMAQLVTLFTLVALLCYVWLRESIAAAALRFYCGIALFLLATMLAVLSKENGALVVVYVLAIEWLVYGFRSQTDVERFRLRLFFGLFIAVPMVVGGLYLLTHLDRFADYSFRNFTMWERVLTQLHVVFFYIKLVLLPAISDMSLFHDGWPPVRQLDLLTIALGVFWVAVVAAVFLLRRKAPVVSLGLAWFIISHLMESTILGLELVFEHRNYLAAAGLLLIPVYYAYTLSTVRMGVFLSVLLSALLTFMTHARVSEWESEDMIFTLAVRDHPESIRAQVAFAGIQYNRGNLDGALEHAAIAAELDPRGYSSLVLGMLYLCGRNREDEIMAMYEEAVRRAALYPATPASISAMDLILSQYQKNRCQELSPRHMLDWLQAARDQEDNLRNRMFTGYLQRQQGFFYYVLQDRVRGYELMISAFDNTGMASILGEVIDIEIQLGAFETAEHLLGILEETNRERFGTEQLLLDRYREQYEAALAAASSGTAAD